MVDEPPPEAHSDRQLEAELVARFRAGETPLDIVESGDASIEEATQVVDDIREIEGVVVIDDETLDKREKNAFQRGKQSKKEEIEQLKETNSRLRQQIGQLQTDLESLQEENQFLVNQTHQQSERITELLSIEQRAEELAADLEFERHRRERAEEEKEEFIERVENEIETIRKSLEENQQELRRKKREVAEKEQRIKELEDLLVDDIAQVAVAARTVQLPRVGVGAVTQF